MDNSLGESARRVRGRNRNNVSKSPHRDWLAEEARKRSAKEIAEKTGNTPKAAENVRQGLNSISFEAFAEWCSDDPAFAAAFAEHVGLILPGEAEFTGALTHAVNAYVRLKGSGA